MRTVEGALKAIRPLLSLTDNVIWSPAATLHCHTLEVLSVFKVTAGLVQSAHLVHLAGKG